MKNLLILTAVLAALAVGCKLPGALSNSVSSPPSNATNTGSTDTAPADTESLGRDPKGEIVKASTKFTELPFFTAHMKGTGDTPIEMDMQYVAPDRYRMKYSSGMPAGMEMVVIGKDSYMKAGGKWTKIPGGAGANIQSLRDQFTEEGVKRLSNAKFERTETVDGKNAAVYSYKSTVPGSESPFTSSIWINTANGLPMKIHVEYGSGKLKEMAIEYDTDTPVSIDPPVKQ